MIWLPRDYRDTRDWARPWRDPPGWFTPSSGTGSCCADGAKAYHCGGTTTVFGLSPTAVTDRTAFSTDLTSAVSGANLTQGRYGAGPVCNPSVAGYLAGGATGTLGAPVVTADKLTFSSEVTTAQTTADLSSIRRFVAGLSERSTKGYFLGGSTTGGIPGVVTTDLFTYSSEATAAQTTANLSVARFGISGMTEGTTKGYVGGGSTSGGYIATSDKTVYSTDTTAAQTTANLSTARQDYMSASDGSSMGFWAGGQTGTGPQICDKLTFSTDTNAVNTSTGIIRHRGSGSSNGTKGYFGGGVSGTLGGGLMANLHSLVFSTETVTLLGAGSVMSVARQEVPGVSTAGL